MAHRLASALGFNHFKQKHLLVGIGQNVDIVPTT
jgi:hypothetical protein